MIIGNFCYEVQLLKDMVQESGGKTTVGNWIIEEESERIFMG